jgi:hypothetical protein
MKGLDQCAAACCGRQVQGCEGGGPGRGGNVPAVALLPAPPGQYL